MGAGKRALFIALSALLVASFSLAQKAEIKISGGRLGEVVFPHARHHEALKDCQYCHFLFPREPGAIDALKGRGELRPMQVMNNCVGCHRDRIREKLKAGPIRCQGCHVRERG